MSNVVLFCRVSTQIQDYQRQINDLKELAQNRNWTIVNVFSEKISGAKINSERKELKALLDFISKNKVERVLVTELSRLGRDTCQVLEVINILNELKVSLFIQNYNIETLNEEGKPNAMSQFLITILAEVAKMERISIRERMASGYRIHLKSGGNIGRQLGYRKPAVSFYKEYSEEIRLLRKGFSLRNISKITGTAVNTIRKCKDMIQKGN